MKAIYYERFNELPRVERLPDPRVHRDAVILQVGATGICRSDWHGWKGHDPDIRLPHVPGHEFAGTIVEVGKAVKKFKTGMRVTSPFVQACGTCLWCQQGDHQVCSRQEQAGFTQWGSFATFVEIRHADTNVVVLPNDFTDIEAAVLGCRFGTAYRALVDQASIKPGQSVAVFGCGGVGLSAIQIARSIGCQVFAVDVNRKALTLATRVGANYAIHPEDEDGVQYILDLTNGGVYYALDAIGAPEILSKSIQILRRRGKHIQVGLMEKPVSFSMQRIIANELEIIGSHGIQAYRYEDMLSFIKKKKIQISYLIQNKVNLETAIPLMTQMDKNQSLGVSVITSFE